MAKQQLTEYSGRFDRKHVAQVAKLPSSHIPWYASGAYKPCRVTNVSAKCKVDGKTKRPWEKGERDMDEKRAACNRIGGVWEEKFTKKNRPGKMELEFLSPSQAKLMGTKPGPNLRLCGNDGKPGRLVPVSNPRAAKDAAEQFEKCVGGRKGLGPKCARSEIHGSSVTLGSSFGRMALDRNARGQYSKRLPPRYR